MQPNDLNDQQEFRQQSISLLSCKFASQRVSDSDSESAQSNQNDKIIEQKVHISDLCESKSVNSLSDDFKTQSDSKGSNGSSELKE